MITWIAGWPHNGSTLLRQILKDAFGINTVSSYPEPKLDSLLGEGTNEFAERWCRERLAAFLFCLGDSATWYIKTHDIPIDNQKAIFLVRDGRDTVTALSQYWHLPIAAAITGQRCMFGGWSEFYWVWDPKNRPDTLLVRFEDMVQKPEGVIYELERFLNRPSTGKWIDKYAEDSKHYPQLFNGRVGIWKKGMSDDDLDLFWKCHGGVMKELGYGVKGPERQVIAPGE